MQGMAIEPQLGFAFDLPEGRIVQVFATGPSENASVISYYNAALAGLAGPALMVVGSAMVRCLLSRRLRWHPAVVAYSAQPL